MHSHFIIKEWNFLRSLRKGRCGHERWGLGRDEGGGGGRVEGVGGPMAGWATHEPGEF